MYPYKSETNMLVCTLNKDSILNNKLFLFHNPIGQWAFKVELGMHVKDKNRIMQNVIQQRLVFPPNIQFHIYRLIYVRILLSVHDLNLVKIYILRYALILCTISTR